MWKIKPKNSNVKSVQWSVLVCNNTKQNRVVDTSEITEIDIDGKDKSVLLLTVPKLYFKVFKFSNKDSFNNFNVENLLFANSPCNYLFNFKLILKNFNQIILLQQDYIELVGETIIVCRTYFINENIFYILCIYNVYLELCHFSSFSCKFQIEYFSNHARQSFSSPQVQEHFVFVENGCHDGNCEVWDKIGRGDDYYRRQVMNMHNPHEERAINGYRHGHLMEKRRGR